MAKVIRKYTNDSDFIICVSQTNRGFAVSTYDVVSRKHSDIEHFEDMGSAVQVAKTRNKEYMFESKKTIQLTETQLKSVINESVKKIIKEIGDTPKGQRALGGLTARKQLAHKDHMPTCRYAEKARGGDDWDKFAYPNATIDIVNPMYKDYIHGYADYLNAHPDEIMDYERKKYGKRK